MALMLPFLNPSSFLSNVGGNLTGGPSSFLLGGGEIDTSSRQLLHVDVLENEKEYHVIIDVPGANKSNLKLEAWNEHNAGLLYISYDREEDKSLTNNKESQSSSTQQQPQSSIDPNRGATGGGPRQMVLFSEVTYGKHYRTVKLNGCIDIDKIIPKLENGCLTIEVPKKDPSQFKRRIPLQINATVPE